MYANHQLAVAALDTVTPISENETNTTPLTYFHQRLAALGLDQVTAIQHGMVANAQGAILQICRTYAGDHRQYLPQYGKKARRLEKMRRRKTFSDVDADRFRELLYIVRHTPDQLAADPALERYKLWSKSYTGLPPLPLPNNIAIRNYSQRVKGGTIAFTEGYFKAVAAALLDIEMSSFSGNTLFKLDDTVKDYLLQRQPDWVVLLLDGDALDLHGKKVELSSKRLQGFYAGMYNFSAAFFDWCKRMDLQIGLQISVIQPDLPKGLDDLLETATQEEKQGIKDAFLKGYTSDYFRFVRLGKSNFKEKLRDLFYLRNHRQFYEQFKAVIGDQSFTFNGFRYQHQPLPTQGTQLEIWEKDRVGRTIKCTDVKCRDVKFNVSTGFLPIPHFRLLDNPFAVKIPTTHLTVEKYLSDTNQEIQNLLKRHTRLAVESPTGSGKTTYFIKHCQQQRIKAVITVPTVNLARQLAQKHGLTALYGKITPRRKVAALNARITVCTYDTLAHLDDIGNRWLLVDEAHNLVNQYGQVRRVYQPFRAATLRYVVATLERAKKTILLSGTLPPLLCQALDLHLLCIKRKTHPTIEIEHLEAATRTEQTAVLLDELQRYDFQQDEINFVYYNSNQQLQLIKKELLDSGKLTEEDIVIVNREMVNAGQHQIFNEIIQHERIKSPVKLILSTCLIAEGINITNRNVGKVFTVNVCCLDSFRQYVARFRKVDRLSVTCITPPERRLKPAFKLPAELELTEKLNCAQLQVQHYNTYHQQILNTYDADELAYMPDLLSDYHPHGQLLDLIYEDQKVAKVDTLRMLAAIRERQMEDGNSCYFFTRLLHYPEFRLVGSRARPVRSVTLQRLREQRQVATEQKTQLLEQLKMDLLTRPDLPIRAYYLRSQQMQNRHATTFVQITGQDFIEEGKSNIRTGRRRSASEFVDHSLDERDRIPPRNPIPAPNSAEILDYLEQYQAAFTYDWFIRPIRDYLRLHFAGVDPLTIAAEIQDYDPQRFSKKWRAFQTTVELTCYQNKRLRKHLSPLHRLELKFLQRLKKRILERHPEGKLTDTDLLEHTNSLLQYHRYRGDLEHPVVEQAIQLTAAQLERRLQSLFVVEVTKYNGSREYVLEADYTEVILEKRDSCDVPFCGRGLPTILRNPLRMLELYG